MRKNLSLALCLLLILSTVIGLSASALGEEKVSLKLMLYDKEDQLKEVFDMYRAQYPSVELEVTYVDNKSYTNVLKPKLASGEGPDIFENGSAIKELAAAGRVMDLTGEPFVEAFQDAGLGAFMYDGKNYGVPWMSWLEGMFYNKDLYAQAGITELPKTWDEFLDVHQKLADAGIKPQTMGVKSLEPIFKQPMILAISGYYPTHPDFAEKYMARELNMKGEWDPYVQKWAEIVKRGFITPEMLGVDYEQAQDEFATGKAAMWQSGNWAVGSIREKNPDLNFGFYPIPAIEGDAWLLGGPGSCWSISSDTKHPEEAKAFLALWATPEAQASFQKLYGGSSFLEGFKSELDPSMEGAQEALMAGRIYCPWNDWLGAAQLIHEFGVSMQDYLTTSGADEALLLDALTRTDIVRDTTLDNLGL